MVIDHRTQASPGGLSNLKLEYSYDRRNLPTQILESSETGLVAPTTTMYSYDARGRLIAESRSTPDTNGISYDLEYDYDAGGNRIEKRDLINDRRVVYTYDFTDPVLYKSANNRLMFYQTQQLDGTLLSTTYYFYNGIGNPTNVVTELETPLGNSPKFSATRFIYAANAQTVTFMIGETWDPGSCYSAYNITFAREFRYDQARRRYLDRELDPAGLMTSPQTFVTLSETWTDYDDDNAYGDFTVTGGAITQAKQYEPGLGTIDDPTGSPVTKYLHNDQLGTLRTTSTATGSAEPLRVFTAFGEDMSNDSQRYGYVGSWGYQSNAGSSLLHVGARYYDPATGRFLQRDPIGLRGGLNVYAYVRNKPTVLTDPAGLRDESSGSFYDDFSESVSDRFNGTVDSVFGWLSAGLYNGKVGSTFDNNDRDNGKRNADIIIGLTSLCVGAVKFSRKFVSPNPPPYTPINWPNMQTPHPLMGG